ncbi:mediator of RNA polymerase II transcription subunit 1 isoform X2 [Scaptodrosophila lebanonensis]|uniref:Mediator of RNA polymerase II transcription subunit 1 n=1 Tax=Drosophila lebanonensis TaxID=7225 RepID=A0A6J2UGU8_DROLE|nr:mediator of RNA polymerase II transcription subunit 1 isoform X2 [Scaptodrosophila lebanonensis]
MSGANARSAANAAGFVSHIPSIEEKNKQIQQETMMEKLRAKYRNKPKTYEEIKKSVRMYFIEKHYPLDPLCKATLQSALDKLQHYIKVTSRHGLVERLESLSRQLGLKFVEDQQLLFISTDMFYVEIQLDASGNLSDVKVHHECKIDQQSSELVNCLKRGDFADFTVQLEGLSSIYQLNAEPKVKKKAFVALQAMETDIYNLYQTQNHKGDSYDIMSNSAVGLVLQRRGGHPMKLTYFCPPIHLPEGENKATCDFTIEQVMRSPNGLSATVNLEGSSANKLQIMPIVTFSRDAQTGLDMPTYAPLTQNNSMLMPATYVLRLNKPMPVCYETLRALGLPLTGEAGSGVETTPATTVMNLIVQTASRNAIKNTQKGLYVNLPKETHCYFFTDNRKLQGTIISSLPFTEPSQVPRIIAFLKKQALFYTLLSSCVREQQKQYNDMDSTVILEVTAVSFNQITVELQHPYEESLATVDFLLEEGQATCTIYCLSNNYDLLSQKLTRTVRKVLSIPMVIYKLLKCWDEEHQQKLQGVIGTGVGGGGGSAGFGNNSSNTGGSMPNTGGNSFGQFGMEASSGEGGGTFTSISSLKMDSKVRSLADSFAASTSAAAAIAGLINLKRETDPHATAGASGATPPVSKMDLNVPTGAQAAGQGKSSDIEIADKYKNIWKDKTPNLKHCVSITPIPGDGKLQSQSQGQQQQVPNAMDVTRTGGIEIIPLNAQASNNSAASSNAAATTITITPITGKETSSKEKKSGSSSSGSSSVGGSSSGATKRPHDGGGSSSVSGSSTGSSEQKEKKRKKKRDDSPMGPPEKVYSRQNSPAAGSDPTSASGVVRKFSSPSSSPKGGGGGSSSASCAGLMAGVPPGTSLSARPSPKHSPVYSSPKHNTASNSPKSPFGTHSPKHGSSGKPSMSTLKSATAATSLSPKGEKPGSGGTAGVPSSSTATSGGNSGSMVRSFASVGAPVPPLASSVGGGVKRDKDKSGGSSASTGSVSNVVNAASNVAGVSPATAASVVAAVAAAAALKNSQQQQQQQQQQHQQQQLKSSVASLSHLAAGGNLNDYAVAAGAAAAALELSALRKGMAGGAFDDVDGSFGSTNNNNNNNSSASSNNSSSNSNNVGVSSNINSNNNATGNSGLINAGNINIISSGSGVGVGVGVGVVSNSSSGSSNNSSNANVPTASSSAT